ncbi:hypothetical protein [Paenibacillus rigui]|uniref:Uncharacterized protein n=1 Tax=Paenibacillus rigui TaxID=554312 RepID=A0A229UHP8_9BACL|nr:hypothetical protein [Paenibacillus rigui]OXM82881.1 hypothetical protein CF651_28665 [Paenibacillus rigui]
MSEYILVSTTERYKTVTENPDLETVKEYEYYFFGKKKTTFSICKIKNPVTRIVIQGVSEVFPDNSIPIKVFPKFETMEEIEKEIYELDQDEESKIVLVQ